MSRFSGIVFGKNGGCANPLADYVVVPLALVAFSPAWQPTLRLFLVASSWMTSQCSSKMPSFMRITSTTIQLGSPGHVCVTAVSHHIVAFRDGDAVFISHFKTSHAALSVSALP